MHKHFRKVAITCLVFVYLVIAAGAIVRMTGSGMGCPDWPKCFGQYIPPTDISELQWHPDVPIKKGQIIIVDEALRVAKKDFKTSASYSTENWEPYTKHEYALFKPIRTWIEYINRLVTVVLGIPMIFLVILSFSYRKKDITVTLVSVFTFLLLALEAILGKLVVDTNLRPTMISIHLIIALVIMVLLIYLIHRTDPTGKSLGFHTNILALFGIAAIITFIQIIIGIQIRQYVDEQVVLVGETAKNLWLQNPSLEFYVHRSFSIFVVLLNLFLAQRIYKYRLGYSKINWVLSLLFLEIATGIAMYYLDFPFATQPIHLVLASLLFGVQFYLVLEALNTKKRHKSS